MGNEIKVNEYIRTDTGKIDKVINANYYMSQYIECEKGLIFKNNIVKHSSNLIDLIQCGDYVNGYPVRRILNFNNKLCNFDLNKMEWIPLEEIDVWYEVVTKEMMESISYKVERN